MTIEKIYEFVTMKGLSINEFSKKIGVSNGYFAKQRTSNGSISSNIIEKIVSFYPDIDLDWLFRDYPLAKTGKPEVIHENMVPVYPHIATAGKVALFKDFRDSDSEGYITVPNMPKCDGAIPIIGDSMYPLLKSGDLVCYKIKDVNDIMFGEMYIIDWLDGRGDDYLTVKYVAKGSSKDQLKLISYNKHHDDIEISKERIRQLALVKLTIRFNSF